jgi:hypothetical protein
VKGEVCVVIWESIQKSGEEGKDLLGENQSPGSTGIPIIEGNEKTQQRVFIAPANKQ